MCPPFGRVRVPEATFYFLHYNGWPLVHTNKIQQKFKKVLNLLYSSQYRVYYNAFSYVPTFDFSGGLVIFAACGRCEMIHD